MKGLFRVVAASLIGWILAGTVLAEFRFIITRGNEQPTSVSVVPFCWSGSQVLPESVDTIVMSDLSRTGQFTTLPPENMLSQPCDHEQVYFRDWKLLKQDYLVIGQIDRVPGENDRYAIVYRLYDVFREENIHAARVTGTLQQLRDLAHLVSDGIYQKITGVRGVFSTKIAYVTQNRVNGEDEYRLVVADADGHRPVTLFKSNNSLLSLSWSHDGQKLAFTSFDNDGRTYIRIVDRLTGELKTLPRYKGINSGAAFSPDGTELAFVNSKAGNADIYVINLVTRELRKITKHWAIDTEPSWSPDGKKLLFTSERGGKPQIYQVTLDTGDIERLTFEGSFNARAHYSADGKHIVLVHLASNVFHVAALNMETRDLRILTETVLDESPSVAPNGTLLVYATQDKGKGVLAWATVDGEIASIMPSSRGHVREPAWSPYLR